MEKLRLNLRDTKNGTLGVLLLSDPAVVPCCSLQRGASADFAFCGRMLSGPPREPNLSLSKKARKTHTFPFSGQEPEMTAGLNERSSSQCAEERERRTRAESIAPLLRRSRNGHGSGTGLWRRARGPSLERRLVERISGKGHLVR